MKPELSQSSSGPLIRGFLSRLPSDLAGSFTPEQLGAVQRAFGMRYAVSHRIDLRRTVRLPWGRFYLVFLAGRDDRAESTPWRPLALLAAMIGGTGAALVLLG
jgi:hypothetical protein